VSAGAPLSGRPAFVLGNAPNLPVDSLGVLAEQFTIGVNRILLSGFTPTVILWIDSTVHHDCGDELDACGALLVCDRSVACRQWHYGLKTHVGDAAPRQRSTPTVLCCHGNTGCCAARWAVALGCRPVFLVGMGARYAGDRTDFYGRNRWHGRETLGRMAEEVRRLQADHGDKVVAVDGAGELAEVVAGLPPADVDGLKRHLRRHLEQHARG
jgi:hypothetical protein